MTGNFLNPARMKLLNDLYGARAGAVTRLLATFQMPMDQSDPVLSDFYSGTKALRQTAIDYLIRQGAPASALTRDGDGGGVALGESFIELKQHNRFDFSSAEDAQRALIVVARDRSDYALDLIAWLPKTDQVASLLGRAILLGEHELDVSHEMPLKVHTGVLDWLRSDRTGVVIVSERRAWRLLHDEELTASSVAHGLALRTMLRSPSPKIVVSEHAAREAA